MFYFLEAFSYTTFLFGLIVFSTWYRRSWIDLWWFVKTSMRDQSSNRNLELWMIWFPVLTKRFKTALKCFRFLRTSWRLPLEFRTTVLLRKIDFLNVYLQLQKKIGARHYLTISGTQVNILYSCNLNVDACMHASCDAHTYNINYWFIYEFTCFTFKG